MCVCIKVASRSVPNSPHLFVAVVSDRVRGSPQPKTSDDVGTPRAGYSSSKSSSNNVSNDSNDTRDTYYLSGDPSHHSS